MTWWAIDVRPGADARERIGAWLVERTAHAVEERDDGTLVAFAVTEAAAAELVRALHAEADDEVSARRRPVDTVDWSSCWRDGLGPRRFGRLTVVQSWSHESAGDGIRLVLDPETAFGSGEHGSTRAALTLLERLVRPGAQVLDLGSGSGILAIAAALLGATRAIGIETDRNANTVAARNARRNLVARQASFIHGDAAALAPLLGPADVVISNILRTVNTALLPSIGAALAPAGVAIFSGMEAVEPPLFRPAIASAGFTAVDETIDDGWWAVAARLG